MSLFQLYKITIIIIYLLTNLKKHFLQVYKLIVMCNTLYNYKLPTPYSLNIKSSESLIINNYILKSYIFKTGR